MNKEEFIEKFMPNGNGQEGLKIRKACWGKCFYVIPIAIGIETFIGLDHERDESTGYINDLWELYDEEPKKIGNTNFSTLRLKDYVTKEELEDVIFTINNLNKRIMELEENMPDPEDSMDVVTTDAFIDEIERLENRILTLEKKKG